MLRSIIPICFTQEKERELDAKNIYAYRLSKPSPKKETEITPRKKGKHNDLLCIYLKVLEDKTRDGSHHQPQVSLFKGVT